MIISYEKNDYIIGGWWQANPSDKSEKKVSRQFVLKEYKDILNDEELPNKDSLNFDCLFRSEGRYAFFKKESSAKKVFSLAYALSKKVEDVAAIIEIEGRFWAVCIKDGRVFPEGDNVFLSNVSAKEHILSNGFVAREDEILFVSDYKKYFSSVELGPAGILEDIQYNYFNNKNIFIGSVLLLFLGVYFWFQYLDAAEREKVRRLDILRGQEIAMQIEEAKNNPSKYFERPFEKYGNSSNKEFLLNVFREIRGLKEFVNGWQIQKIVFHKDKRVTTWGGDGEFLALPENGEIRGKNVVSTINKNYMLLKDNIIQQLNNKNDIQRYLYSFTANSNTTLSVSWGAAKKKTITIASKRVELIEPWETGSFTISNVPYYLLSDFNFIDLLSVYGLIIEQIEYQNQFFTIRGKIFVNKG